MRRALLFLTWFSLIAACRNNTNSDGAGDVEEKTLAAGTDSLQFPILIEGGTKVVYQVGRMTPDKGLKFYLDTADYREGRLPDSLKITSLFPLSLSGPERDTALCVIVIDQQGYWHETILGTIDKTSRLRLKYANEEIYLQPLNEVLFKEGQWSAVFQDNILKVKISVVLEDTKIGDHLTGQGELRLWRENKLMEQKSIFLIYSKI
jgi:hypothetical protein